MFNEKKLDSYFYTTPGFYLFYIPIGVPYKKLYSLADAAGVQKKEALGPILEKGSLFGKGWIGVEIENPRDHRPDVVHISGTFETYEHHGPYKTLGKAYQIIKKERPSFKEFYNLYLDDPDKVGPENCRTVIYFN